MRQRLGKFVNLKRCCSSNSKSIEELEQEFTQLRIQSGLTDYSKSPENVLIVHPKIRWGQKAAPDENIGLKMEEACALVKTLPGFSICRYFSILLPIII